MMPSSSPKSLRDLAKRWVSSGLSVIPIKDGGSKGAALRSWKEFQTRRLTEEEIDKYFKPGLGIAVIGGAISGNLEILDFDVPEGGNCVYDEWIDQLSVDLIELVEQMPLVRTAGGGRHLYYRCDEIEGNKKLASKLAADGTQKTIIETRGEGGYVLAPGCPPECHPKRKTYDLLRGGDPDDPSSLANIPTISPVDRERLFASARSFNEVEVHHFETGREFDGLPEADSNRPGDDFNRRASWHDILDPEGWIFIGTRRSDSAELWKRPGKEDRGISATVRNIEGQELFHCFSSNSGVFPVEQSITKFTAYTLLYHDGDFEAAARELGKRGYGEPPRAFIDFDTAISCKRDDDVPWSTEPSSYDTRFFEPDSYQAPPPDLPFVDDEPPEASIWYEQVDALDAQLAEGQEKVQAQRRRREKKKKAAKRADDLKKGPGYLVWRDFGDEPDLNYTDDGRIKVTANQPRTIMWHCLNDRFCGEDGLRSLHYQQGEFMIWNGLRYRRLKIDDTRPHISHFLTGCAEFDGLDDQNQPKYVPYKVRKSRVEELVVTAKDMTYLDGDTQDPCWLCDDDDMPDPREVVCCTNGLLDIRNGELLPPTPSYYCFSSTNIHYDPDVPQPEVWLKFLKTSLDEESQLLLQQWFGYCLVQDTRLQKMLMCVGKPRSGKGTAMTMLEELVGRDSCCSMDFDRMDGNFALSVALGKSLMIFPDARQGYRSDQKGSVVGNLLSITGEDALLIDRKRINPITTKLNTRIVIVSNDIINLSDPSGALNRRMLWLKFPGFEGKEDPDLKNKLHEELSGILNWAIDGWHSLHKTGEFVTPKSAKDITEMFQAQASPIKTFISDMCDTAANLHENSADLYKYWVLWRKAQGYGRPTSQPNFGKMLLSADMRISKARMRIEGTPTHIYRGIKLNATKVEQTIKNTVGTKAWKVLEREHAQTSIGDIIEMDVFKLKRGLEEPPDSSG